METNPSSESYYFLVCFYRNDYFVPHSQLFIFSVSEFYSEKRVFANAYPCLFPGGVGDIYDVKRGSVSDLPGPVKNLRSWAKHLLHYCDGRFLKDQLFMLYIHNTVQRHENNSKGNFFFNDKNFLGKVQPSLEELKEQVRDGNYTFVSKLRYFSQSIRGSDGYWRNKQNELKSWIDFHVSRHHGPPTHFITLTCAENWWEDLRGIFSDLEKIKERELQLSSTTKRNSKQNMPGHESCDDFLTPANTLQSRKLDLYDQTAMRRAARDHSAYVNHYFMKRAKIFMDTFAKDALDLEYYWGRVEFASGRGQIHLHILGIAKNKAYLNDFYNAKCEDDKTEVLAKYAVDKLGMTADVSIDEKHNRFTDENRTTTSPAGTRFVDCKDIHIDHCHLVQDTMMHECNDYCLGEKNLNKPKCRKCRFNFGTEQTANNGDTLGQEYSMQPRIEKDFRGIEHLRLPRTQSRWTNQHSRPLLQAWRANADIQLIIYRSNPDVPDVGEIEAVSRYCVAYAGKRYQTTRQEINAIQDVIFR